MLIQRLRDGTQGVIAKIIVGLIIVVFGLFGFGSITTFLAPVPEVATVNGEPITQREMETAVERSRRRILAEEDADPASIDEDRLREDVLQFLIAQRILGQKADELGLRFSDAGIDADIVATPAFQLEGRFDAEQFKLALSSAGYTPMMYRDELRASARIQQLVGSLAESQFVTEAEAQRASSLIGQTRDFSFILITVDSLLNETEVTDEEVAEHYEQNLPAFVTEESISLEYIELLRDDLAEQLELMEADVLAHFEETKEDYAVEEARRISHILVATAEGALAEAQALRERLLAGEDFAALAEEASADPGSAGSGGDLGFNTRGAFVPEFEAAAFALPVDEVSEPVQTEFGYHLIKVTEIEEGSQPEFAEVREEVEASLRTLLADEDFISLSTQLGDLLFESADLTLPAATAGIDVQTASEVKRAGNEGVLADPEVIAAAFSPEVLADGNNSDVIELSETHHLALRVTSHSPAEQRPLEAVQGEAKEQLVRERATEAAADEAAEILGALREGAEPSAAAAGRDWQAQESASREVANPDPEAISDEDWASLVNSAFGVPRPLAGRDSYRTRQLPSGDSLVLRVTAAENPAPTDLPEEEAAALAQALAAQLGEVDLLEVRRALVESASIVTE